MIAAQNLTFSIAMCHRRLLCDWKTANQESKLQRAGCLCVALYSIVWGQGNRKL